MKGKLHGKELFFQLENMVLCFHLYSKLQKPKSASRLTLSAFPEPRQGNEQEVLYECPLKI